MSEPGKKLEGSEKKQEASKSYAEYPSNQKRIVIMAALYLTIFLVTLV
jgi:hypothetical protein